MIIAKCTEGALNIPKFAFDLYGGIDREGPSIMFALPYECWPDDYHGYDGAGVFEIDLEGLLNGAVQGAIDFDHGESAHEITSLLRKYADKIDDRVSEFRKSKLTTR